MNDSGLGPRGPISAQTTWRDRFLSSLLLAALLTGAWTVVVVAVGAWSVNTSENLGGLLNAGLNNLISLTILIFLAQAIWFWVRTRG